MNTQRSPLLFSLIYLILASIWIIFSDLLLSYAPAAQRELLSSGKGLLFVLANGALLYWLLQRYRRQKEREQQRGRRNEERLSQALQSAGEGLWDWDLDSGEIYYSQPYCELLGETQQSFALSRKHWDERLHPDDRAQALARVEQLIKEGRRDYENSFRIRHRDGSYRWLHSRGQLLLDANGLPQRFIGTSRDITAQRATEDSLRQAAAVFDSTQEGVLVTDAQRCIVHINPAFTRITGYSAEEVLGRDPHLFKSGRQDRLFYRKLWQTLEREGVWSGEIWNRRKNGEVFPMWQSIRRILDDQGRLTHYVAVFSDLSLIKHSQNELDFLAHHDPLTQLPNRLLLSDRITQALRLGRRGALLVFDLDHFKNINESLGHSSGDLLLRLIGERLLERLPEQATLARLGGDEFALLAPACGDGKQAGQLAQHLLDSFSEPFLIDGEVLFISASIGISLFPADGNDVEQLLRNADSALFRAKDSGRQTYSFYSQEMTADAQLRVRLDSELRQALEQGQLCVHYQPIHRLGSRRLCGAEALVRWQHPQRGMIPPGEFIPLAEDSGLIGAIDAWVLEQACLQMRRWLDAGRELEFIAVNVSSRLFSRGDLAARVCQMLQRSGLAARHLELEVTESAVMDNPEHALRLLGQLRELGVRLAIDDFGTGYSSLERLRHLPVHKLKLDQSFVRGLPHDGADAAIARAVVTLGQSLGLQVLAEGIEEETQAVFLRGLGCDLGQGYWFGHPLPAEHWPAT